MVYEWENSAISLWPGAQKIIRLQSNQHLKSIVSFSQQVEVKRILPRRCGTNETPISRPFNESDLPFEFSAGAGSPAGIPLVTVCFYY